MNPYEQRRRRVLDQLQFGEMMVLYSGESVASSMDEGFEFEANHHFFYLTGLRRENMALVLANTHHPAHVILFIEEPIPDMERWTGRRVTIDEAKAVSGIDDVRYIDSVESLISRCVARETVYSFIIFVPSPIMPRIPAVPNSRSFPNRYSISFSSRDLRTSLSFSLIFLLSSQD